MWKNWLVVLVFPYYIEYLSLKIIISRDKYDIIQFPFLLLANRTGQKKK